MMKKHSLPPRCYLRTNNPEYDYSLCGGCAQDDQGVYRCYSFQRQIDYAGRLFCADLRDRTKKQLSLFDYDDEV